MKCAIILSAGRGERLRPLTDTLPKPLCILHGKPLIVHHIEKLAQSGFNRIVINHAWLGGKIRRYLGNGQTFGLEILYTPEPPGGLETAGGIVNALPFLDDAFVSINADIYTDYDLSHLTISDSAYAKLVLVPANPALQHKGDFGLEHGQVSNDDRRYTYAGIAFYKRKLFTNCPFGRYSLTPILRKHADSGHIQGEIHQGIWFDPGSKERYAYAREQLDFTFNRGSHEYKKNNTQSAIDCRDNDHNLGGST